MTTNYYEYRLREITEQIILLKQRTDANEQIQQLQNERDKILHELEAI